MSKMSYYKFVRWDAAPLEEVKQSATIKAYEEYENGNAKPLKEFHPVLDDPNIKIGGWCFNVRPLLKRYWVKLKQYGINEYFALNKTDIQKKFGSYVIEIVEIKSKEF